MPIKTILTKFKDNIKTEIEKNTSTTQLNEIKGVLKKQNYFGSKELKKIFM